MSSDDSEFDKEAEREKLRKKYEQDQKDRENTRRMSELLLQGATMTGKHCSECSDPIFRYDGQEFCPTCQQEVEDGAARDQAAAEADDPSARETTAETNGDDSDPDRAERSADDEPEDRSDASGEPRVEIDGVRVADRQPDPSNYSPDPSDETAAGERRDARRHARTHDADGRARSPDAAERARSSAGDADLDAARESLVRTLTDFARRAEETDDVARATDLLAATREAAEALAALDGANR